MSRKDDIQGLLGDRFKNFEAEPPKDIWKEIEGELYPDKKRTRKLWPYLSVAASIAILIFALIYFNGPTTSESMAPLLTQATPEDSNLETIPQASLPDDLDSQDGNPFTSMVEDVFKPIAKPQKQADEIDRELLVSNEPNKQMADASKQEIPEENMTSIESQTDTEIANDAELAVSPIQKEVAVLATSDIQSPEVNEIPVSEAFERPYEEEESNRVDFSNLSIKSIVNLASSSIDKIKNASPVKIYEEKNDKGESRVYQLNLFKLSVSHKTKKRRNKKVRL